MGFLTYAKDLIIVSSILSLFLMGLTVSLRSGVASMGRDGSRQFISNASGLILAVAGCVTLLLVLQEMVGIRFGSRW